MIHPIELRPGNYLHPANDSGQANTSKYLRVISLDLKTKIITAKEDYQSEILSFDAADVFPCSFQDLMTQIGGMSFGEHSIIIKSAQEVLLMLSNGTPVELPHIKYLHQFQNLVKSLTGQEMAFNVKATDEQS